MSTPSDSDQWTLVSRKGRRSHNPSSDTPVSGGPGKGRRRHNPTNNIPVVGDRSTSQGQQPADPVIQTEASEPVDWGFRPAPQPDLPIKRGGWDIPPGHGLFGGQPQPTRRNLFGLKPDEIQAALEDSPPRDPAPTPPAGPPSPVPAAAPPAAAQSSPNALLCKFCLESQSKHKCSQCGLVRCTQFHMDIIDEGRRTYICQDCDPTVTGVLKLSTMWRMPGIKSPESQPQMKKKKTSSTPPTSPPPTSTPPTSTSKRRKRVQWSPAESANSCGLPPSSAPAGPAGPSRADR